MEPADSICRLGFARWYERRLIEGHAWFITGFFCMIAIAAFATLQRGRLPLDGGNIAM